VAIAKRSRVVDVQTFGSHTRMLSLEMTDGQPLGFRGGQYVIVDGGVRLASGKALKRAYSILSSDARQDRFEIAVRRVEAGLGSEYMHGLGVGSDVSFSGPWGKFYPPNGDAGAGTLLAVTDTGITSALGLIRSSAYEHRLAGTDLLWFVAGSDDFLPPDVVDGMLPAGLGSFRMEVIDPVGRPGRESRVISVAMAQIAASLPVEVFLAGDGAAILPLRGALIAGGLAENRVMVECYFNNPAKKSV
jgi:ferredoxin-NADP reductase